MPTVTIRVAGTEAPATGKKRGRIKDESGTLYQAVPDFLNTVKIGQSYELTYKDDEFNGNKFRVVEGVKPAANVAPQPMAARPQVAYSDPHKDESIAVLAILKCFQPLEVGDRAAIFHALKAAAFAWRDFKKWQVDGNIETGRQPLQREYYEEFPEQ